MLVEAAHANVMFPTRKAYTRDVLLSEEPDVSAQELAGKLNMSLGEALVLLDELSAENKKPV